MTKKQIFRALQYLFLITTCVCVLLYVFRVIEQAWWVPIPALFSVVFGGLASRAEKEKETEQREDPHEP
jgi:hypothetical protein